MAEFTFTVTENPDGAAYSRFWAKANELRSDKSKSFPGKNAEDAIAGARAHAEKIAIGAYIAAVVYDDARAALEAFNLPRPSAL